MARHPAIGPRVYGSGFVVQNPGLIVTNYHVITGNEDIVVAFSDQSRAQATIVGIAPTIDLAVLKAEIRTKLPALRFADSDELRIGQSVLAIGNPLSLGTSVSAGVISALNRSINNGPFDNLIQTDAGNQPKAIAAAHCWIVGGEVVGVDNGIVTTAKGSGFIGLGFAIPSNDVSFVVTRLIRDGRVIPGWLGLDLQDMAAALAQAEHRPDVSGALVSGIDPRGPALLADVQEGEVILGFDGAPVGDARALRRRRRRGSYRGASAARAMARRAVDHHDHQNCSLARRDRRVIPGASTTSSPSSREQFRPAPGDRDRCTSPPVRPAPPTALASL